MADIPRSSFIPKQNPGAVPSRVKRRKKFHALSYSTTVVLIASLLLAGGTFFYKDYLSSRLEAEKLALAAERDQFNEADIASVQELDYQMGVAKLLLESHLSPSKLFDTLELTTKQRIQFTDFGFEQRPSQDVTLTIKGGTEEFKTVAVQALEFEDDPILKDAVFSDIGTFTPTVEVLETGVTTDAADHEVSFSVTSNIPASVLMYDGIGGVPVAEEEESIGEDMTKTATGTASTTAPEADITDTQ